MNDCDACVMEATRCHGVNNLYYLNCVKYCSYNGYCSSCQTENLQYERSKIQQLVYAFVYHIYHISANL